MHSSGHLTAQDCSPFSFPLENLGDLDPDLGVKSEADSGRIPPSGVQSKELIKLHRSEGDL